MQGMRNGAIHQYTKTGLKIESLTFEPYLMWNMLQLTSASAGFGTVDDHFKNLSAQSYFV